MKKIFLCTVLMIASNLYSQNYILDSSFGIGGTKKYFTTATNPEPAPINVFYNNNKYFLVQDYKIASFDYNGNRDLTFGTNGQLKLSTVSSDYYSIKGAKLVNDKIYIFGCHDTSGHNRNSFIARILLNGTFDTTFGNAGVSFFDIGQADNIYEDDGDCFNDIKVHDDGTIFALGQTTISTPAPFQPGLHSAPIFALSKITASQTLDTTFAPNRYINYGTGAGVNILDYQGEMLLVGSVLISSVWYTKLTLISSNGNSVASFGDNGTKILYNPGGVTNSVIFNGNTIYMSQLFGPAGGVYGGVKAIDLTTFSTMATMQAGGSVVCKENAGKMYVTDGTCGSCDITGTSDFRVRRYNNDGSLDTSFDSDGQFTYTFPSVYNPQSYATGIYIHDDGKIFMAGRARTFIVNDTGGGLGMIRLEITTLGTPEFNKSFSIAPNPVSEKLYLQNNTGKEIYSTAIIDNTGRTLFTKSGNIDNLDVSFLQEGIYYLEISSENNYQTIKFLKK